MTGRGTTLRLAAVQAQALPGKIGANLEHAGGLVEHAAGQGATMVVLPELFSCGYVPNREVWDAAEDRCGRTDRWLAATARRLGIYLGAGAAESDGTDFFNVFTLAAPDGQIAGRAYKANAEASIFRRGRAAHVIDTPAGRIGVGICADNQFAATLRVMHEQHADLILMPHAWPTLGRAAHHHPARHHGRAPVHAISRQRRRKARAAAQRTNDPAGMTVWPGSVLPPPPHAARRTPHAGNLGRIVAGPAESMVMKWPGPTG